MTEDADGQELVFDFQLDAPPEKVWRALTIPAFRDLWLSIDATGQAAGPAGPVETELLEAEPPVHLRWRWQERGGLPGTVTFTLAPNAEGGTALRLVHERRAKVLSQPANGNVTMALAA